MDANVKGGSKVGLSFGGGAFCFMWRIRALDVGNCTLEVGIMLWRWGIMLWRWDIMLEMVDTNLRDGALFIKWREHYAFSDGCEHKKRWGTKLWRWGIH